jgi:exopolysaccharide biosynthesis polyprenyl glycosylphosphotransferase
MTESVSIIGSENRDVETDSVPELHPGNGWLPTGVRLQVPLYEDLLSGLNPRTRDILRRRSRSGRARSGALVLRCLAIADTFALGAAWLLTALLADLTDHDPPLAIAAFFLACVPLWLVLGHAYGLDDEDVKRTGGTTADDAVRLLHFLLVGGILMYLCAQVARFNADVATIALFCALAVPLLVVARACARAIVRRRPSYTQNVVIVGAGRMGQLVASKLIHGCPGLNVVGFVDLEPTPLSRELVDVRFLGGLESLPTVVRLLDVERVIVAFSSDSNAELLTLVHRLDDAGVQVDIVPRLVDALGPRARLHELCGLPLVGLPPSRPSAAAMAYKRILDAVGSGLLLVLLAPVLACVALTVRLSSAGPVFYKSERIGRNGKRFKLLKFRTMRIEHCRGAEYGGERAEVRFRELLDDPARRAEFESAHKLDSDPRVTRVGEVLRRSSLDELPQLFNVLRGDLALVGPRPITEHEYYDLQASAASNVGEEPAAGYWTIQDLRPGLTGYWQINGRSSTTYEERVRLDTAYATSWSLKLDLLILAKTGAAILDRRNAY